MTEDEEQKLRSFVYCKMFQRNREGRDFKHRWGDVIDVAIKSKSSSEFMLNFELNGLEASEDFKESLGRAIDTWERTEESRQS